MTRFIMLLIFGACVWGFVIGFGLAVVAPNGFPGLLLTLASFAVGAGVLSWLATDGHDKD